MLRVATEAENLALQRVILPVVATGVDGSFRPIGTCWIFAIAGRTALAFSAVHIFDEVVRSEGRHERTAASIPNIIRPLKPRPIALASTYLKAIYRYSADHAFFLELCEVHRDGLADVAVCELEFPPDAPADCAFDFRLAIHAGPVDYGTPVAAVGYAGMERTDSKIDEETGVVTGHFYQQLAFEHGRCIAYHPRTGPRGPAGPCFEIDVSTKHGMSGGPIFHKGYGDAIVGCGVISRGTAFGADEITTASALWPAYSLSLPNLRDENDRPLSLVDLTRFGHVDDRTDGPAHFKMVRTPGVNVGKIAWE